MKIITKIFEVRDRATLIPTIAICIDTFQFNEQRDTVGDFLVNRAGYDGCYVMVSTLKDLQFKKSWKEWDYNLGRTLPEVHKWLANGYNFINSCSGDVIDVEFILGEVDKPKVSERKY